MSSEQSEQPKIQKEESSLTPSSPIAEKQASESSDNNNNASSSKPSHPASDSAPSSLPNPPVAHPSRNNRLNQFQQHLYSPQQVFIPSHQQQYPPHNQKNYNMKGPYNNQPGYNNYQNYSNNHDNFQHGKNNGGNRMNNRHNNNNNGPNSSNNGYKKNNYRNYQPQMYGIPNSMMPIPPYYPVQPTAYAPMQPQTAVLPEKPITSPIKKHTRLSIKNKDGTPVSFIPSHGKTASTSSISSPPASEPAIASISASHSPVAMNATIKPSIPAANAPSPSSTTTTSTSTTTTPNTSTSPVSEKEEPKKTAESKKAFQLQFLQQLKAKKAAAAATSGSTSTPAADSASKEIEKKEETKEPTVESESKVTEEPKTESTSEIPTTIPTPQVEEEKEVTEPVVESTETEVKKDTEEPPTTSETIPEPEKPVEAIESKTEDVKEEENETTPSTETTETAVETPKRMTMTEFLAKIEIAKPILDPLTFKYPEPYHGPVEISTSTKKRVYDPAFLFQFEKLNYEVDDQWREKCLSKIYIPDKNESRDKSFKNRDNRTHSSGPMRGIIRGEFEGRNNSRTGSRRGGKGRDSRDSRDGRDRSRRDRDRENSRKSRGGRGEKSDKANAEKVEEKPQVKIPPEDVKPLEKATNRWVPRSQRQVTKEVKYAPDGVTVLYDDEDLEKKIRSLLNKLSLEQFDSISEDLLALANQSKWETDAKALKTTVKLTFAKATDEPHWSSMYAKFCQRLVAGIDPSIYSEDYPVTNPTSEQKYYTGTNLAYRLLVSRCQTEYEKGWSTDLPVNEDGSPIEPELMSDEYYELAAQKRRGLGLVRFIGELYRLSLLQHKVLVGCIKILTAEDGAPPSESYLPQEDTLETLNQFLLTVGGPLERDVPGCIAYAFTCINNYIKNPKIGSRIKYKFLDLIDLRKSGWRNAADKLGGPKTISQIHAEFNKKAQTEQRERSLRSRSSKGSSKWGNDQISSTDISKVGMIRKSGDSSINVLRKGKQAPSTSNDFTTVSSRSKSTRGAAPSISRSASTSSNLNASTAADEGSESRQQSNRFNLLMGDEDHSASEDEGEANTGDADDDDDDDEEEEETKDVEEGEEKPEETDAENTTTEA